MKIIMFKTNRLSCLLLAGLFLLLNVCAVAAPARKPNFVIIFTDDQGYGDVSCFGGAKGYETPELDRMADQGMRFTDFHVGFYTCSMSRACLLTGRYHYRWTNSSRVYFPRSKDGMPQSEVTIAEVLKQEGYATALVGKWHLGHLPQFLPTQQGFDSYYGIPYSNDMAQDGSVPLAKNVVFREGMTLEDYKAYQPHTLDKAAEKGGYRKYKDKVPLMSDTEVIEWPVDQSTLVRRYTEKAIEFIDTNRDKPFFLYYAHAMPHTPLFVSDKFKGATERGLYGDVIREIDWSVGQVLQALRDRGLAENTLVVFTTDNGPWLVKGAHGGSAGQLRDGKGSSYEGGQRVPCIFWWPGKIPSGVVTDYDAATLDIMPTFAKLAGASLPDDRPIDGLDIRAVLAGKEAQAPERPFFIYGRGEGIRVGDWKYRKGKMFGSWAKREKGKKNPSVEQLFNLKDDLGEQNNLIEQYPEKVEELKRLLQQQMNQMQG